MAKRCRGRLFLETMAGVLLVRRSDGLIYGYCECCREPVALKRARRLCNRNTKVTDA